jgi:hypothetical protein
MCLECSGADQNNSLGGPFASRSRAADAGGGGGRQGAQGATCCAGGLSVLPGLAGIRMPGGQWLAALCSGRSHAMSATSCACHARCVMSSGSPASPSKALSAAQTRTAAMGASVARSQSQPARSSEFACGDEETLDWAPLPASGSGTPERRQQPLASLALPQPLPSWACQSASWSPSQHSPVSAIARRWTAAAKSLLGSTATLPDRARLTSARAAAAVGIAKPP